LTIIELNVIKKFLIVNTLEVQQGAQAAQGLEIKTGNFSVPSPPSPFPSSSYSSFLLSFPLRRASGDLAGKFFQLGIVVGEF
jgi:hypothetical protein